MKLTNKNLLFAIILLTLTVIVKIICAPILGLSGFTTIIAIALLAGFSGSQKNSSLLLPLATLFASDVVIEILYQLNLFDFKGFYSYQFLNYTLILITVALGWLLKGNTKLTIVASIFIAPTVYFLLSNLSVWALGSMYPKTATGLITCYEAGLPFYKNQLISTALFVPVIVVLYNYINSKQVKLAVN